MTLIIDTATKYLYLALVNNNNEVLEELILEGHNDHSKTLMPSIEEIFKKHNLKVSDLSTIVCGVGPGSYTGVRIGVIVAKMLAYKNNIKLRKIDTLILMSSGFQGEVASVIDARRGDGYVALMNINDDKVDLMINDRFGCKNEFLDEVQIVSQAVVNEDGIKTNPLVIIKNSIETTVDDILPNYLRVTEAERNLGE